MSRSGYDYDGDCESNYYLLYPSIVRRATNGKRGQSFFKALRDALEALPEKRLVPDELQTEDGAVCALGALGRARGVELSKLDPEDVDGVAKTFGVAATLVREVTHANDDEFKHYGKRIPLYGPPTEHMSWFNTEPRLYIPETPEERYERVLGWVRSQIIAEQSA